MGNKNNTQTIQHPCIGAVLKSDGQHPLIKASFPFVDRTQADLWLSQLAKVKTFKNRHLFLPRTHAIRKSFNCTQSQSIQLQFQDFSCTLKNEILERYNDNLLYSQEQIWKMMYQLSQVALDFQLSKMKLGSIHPQNILLSNRQFRLVNKYSWPGDSIGIQKILQSNKGCYLSPQQLNQFMKKKLFGNESKPLGHEDAFSIGMTILEMSTLLSSQDLYDFKKGTIDREQIKRRLQLITNNYGNKFLTRTIDNLLQQKIGSRFSCGQLHAMLQYYQPQILSLQKFEMDLKKSREYLSNYNELRKSRL